MTNMEVKQEREWMEDGHDSVHDLCRECLEELKIAYMTELVNEGTFAEVMGVDYDEPSGYDISFADELIPDDVVCEHYAGIGFVPDDFFCLMETEE